MAIPSKSRLARFSTVRQTVLMRQAEMEQQMKNVMTPYYSILDRDVPVIIAKAKNLARQGIIGPLDVYYKHEAICCESSLLTNDPTDEGWKHANVSIPCNIEYGQYYNFLAQRLTRIPLYA
jgi:hypothetical protein